MGRTLGEGKWGLGEKTRGLGPEKGGRWRDPRDSPCPRESCGALCKPQLFPGVWRYGGALLPHGSLVPGGLRSARGVAGGPDPGAGVRPESFLASLLLPTARGLGVSFLNRGVGEVGRLLLGIV